MTESKTPTPRRPSKYAEMMREEKRRREESIIPWFARHMRTLMEWIFPSKVRALVNLVLIAISIWMILIIIANIGVTPYVRDLSIQTIGALIAVAIVGVFGMLVLGSKVFKKILKTWDRFVKVSAHASLTFLLLLANIGVVAGNAYVSSPCFGITPFHSSDTEFGVVITKFEQMSGNQLEPDREWKHVLDDTASQITTKIKLNIVSISRVLHDEKEAKVLAECFQSSILIWGNVRAALMESHYLATPRWDNPTSSAELKFPGLPQDQALYISPGEEPLYFVNFFLGGLYVDHGDYQEAIRTLSKAIELVPQDNVSHRKFGVQFALANRGLSYYMMGEREQAIADYTMSIALSPSQVLAVYANRAQAYREEGEYELALSDYTEVIRMEPSFYYAYEKRGWLYVQLHQYQNAIRDYTEAIRLNPNPSLEYHNRGNLYFELGKIDEAENDWDEYIKRSADPKQAEATLAAEGIYRRP
jgi:tetratricopeptide (TPR) repeat protein